MLENFTTKFTAWAHEKKSINTNQAHGAPANLLDLYAAVDIPESETFGSTTFDIPGLRKASTDAQSVEPDISILKFASSAAHVMGKSSLQTKHLPGLQNILKHHGASASQRQSRFF